MTNSAPKPTEKTAVTTDNLPEDIPQAPKAKDSYIKLAMRNMVRKGRQSLWHFFLTTVGLVGLLVGLAYLTKP
ncbi:DUF3285 domain-containing protein [Pleurocapsales cyanobacterium LEGE 10410]|nr:DUF3285 domain-containing protein [Pleurocapsales cyanobacterium LEGE 10410]